MGDGKDMCERDERFFFIIIKFWFIPSYAATWSLV
jgi:hypothetical protein